MIAFRRLIIAPNLRKYTDITTPVHLNHHKPLYSFCSANHVKSRSNYAWRIVPHCSCTKLHDGSFNPNLASRVMDDSFPIHREVRIGVKGVPCQWPGLNPACTQSRPNLVLSTDRPRLIDCAGMGQGTYLPALQSESGRLPPSQPPPRREGLRH
ncbi:hypothetical protein DSO57_1016553 [Entomophthora muscae]|uniref:Uncharacterized protein n=1 Tax=Entomophthora muscae TaxID=34485 RepID=A0ACC2RJK8_9FUNG|nr:hypothetical protein DSO57_1016553 [Entomophthora muscae]